MMFLVVDIYVLLMCCLSFEDVLFQSLCLSFFSPAFVFLKSWPMVGQSTLGCLALALEGLFRFGVKQKIPTEGRWAARNTWKSRLEVADLWFWEREVLTSFPWLLVFVGPCFGKFWGLVWFMVHRPRHNLGCKERIQDNTSVFSVCQFSVVLVELVRSWTEFLHNESPGFIGTSQCKAL